MRTSATLVACVLSLLPTLSTPAQNDQANVLLGSMRAKTLAVDAYQPMHLNLVVDANLAVDVAVYNPAGRLVGRRIGGGAVDVYLPGPSADMLKALTLKAEALKAEALLAEARRQKFEAEKIKYLEEQAAELKAAAIKAEALAMRPLTRAAMQAVDVFNPTAADVHQPSNSSEPAGDTAADTHVGITPNISVTRLGPTIADLYNPSADIVQPNNSSDPASPFTSADLIRPVAGGSGEILTGGPCTYTIEITNRTFRKTRVSLIADVIH